MKKSKLLWGLFFIAAALLVVINQMGYFTGIGLWSLLITVVMIPVIGHGVRYRNFFNIFFGIAIILIVFEQPLGIGRLVPWTVLAAALFLSIGFSIIIKPKYQHWHHAEYWNDEWRKHSHEHYESTEHIDIDGSDVSCRVSMGGSSKYLHSDSLQKGYFDCSLGYLKVYFDSVELNPDGAEIFVNCSLGSMELYIPRTWNVRINVDATLAGVSETPRRDATFGPTLTISGSVRLGAVEIKYI